MRFTKSHEWARMEGDIAVVGITDHAQSELNDIVYVELPEVGKSVRKGDVLATLESVKSAEEVYAPLSGEIVEVNTALEDQPELINRDAEGEGWLVKIRVTSPEEYEELMSEEEYRRMVEG